MLQAHASRADCCLPAGARDVVDGRRALKSAMANSHRKFMYIDERQTANAGYRLRQSEIVPVKIEPKFRLPPKSRVFTIGSCFARNVESKLIEYGFDVPARRFSLPSDYYYNPTVHGTRAALNKYTAHSILFEIDRVLNTLTLNDEGFVQVGDGQWYDPHCSQVKPRPLAECQEVRQQVAELTAELLDCEFVFMTLGLTESWMDLELGVPINLPPKPNILKALPDRFGFVNVDYPSVLDALERTITLLRERSRSEIKFIVTVSPVPLQMTYTEQDVIRANTYSKAVLRAASETLAAKYEYVDYFPSYDILLHSPRQDVWQEDEVHVQSTAVAEVIKRFANHYLKV